MLTDFQTRCEDALLERLEFYGSGLTERRVDEDGEPFIYGQLDERDIEVWIYIDGAAFRAGRRKRAYEVPVFSDESAAILAFVEGVTKELTRS